MTTRDTQEVFRHPYNKIEDVPADTRMLIVGTCPPHRFCSDGKLLEGDVPFYYGSVDNYLWKEILPRVFDRTVPATREAREEFLHHRNMWMFDIFQLFTRKDLTASDGSLEMVDASDIGRLLSERPTIDTICFTGTTAERKTREKLISDGLLERNSPWIRTGDMPRRNILPLKLGRDVTTYTLPSPNPNSARPGYTLDVQVEIYMDVFAKH